MHKVNGDFTHLLEKPIYQDYRVTFLGRMGNYLDYPSNNSFLTHFHLKIHFGDFPFYCDKTVER